MKELLDELRWRGLLYDATPELEDRLAEGPVAGYCGFDPTAASLQLGNLVPVMLLAHLQRHGGRPIVLMGGGTGQIGDPSGKQVERPLLEPEEVAANAEKQARQLRRFLDFESSDTGAVMVNNADWLGSEGLIPFLRDIGKHFTISQMLQKESIRSRLDSGISFTEFSYMLLQALDFLMLFRSHGCELQLGGSDQWGNITAGTELIRRLEGRRAHGLCAPLVTTASGAKFGKTESGAVWLDAELTSPYRFYQFWINVDDRDIERYLKIFTFRDRSEIETLMEEHRTDPGARKPHRELAYEMTARVHGERAADEATAASELVFGGGELANAGVAVWQTLATELPSRNLSRDALPLPIVDLLAESGLTASRGEARRQLKQGGIYVNEKRADPELEVRESDLLAGSYLWLRKGKKSHRIVEFTS